jgi:hypothetical protein
MSRLVAVGVAVLVGCAALPVTAVGQADNTWWRSASVWAVSSELLSQWRQPQSQLRDDNIEAILELYRELGVAVVGWNAITDDPDWEKVYSAFVSAMHEEGLRVALAFSA